MDTPVNGNFLDMRSVGAMRTRIQDDNRSSGGDSDTDLWADVDDRYRRIRAGTINSDPTSHEIDISRPVCDFQLERRDQDHSKSDVSRHIPDCQSLSIQSCHSESSSDAADCEQVNGSNMYELALIAPLTEVSRPDCDLQVERWDRDHSKSEVFRHIPDSQSLSNQGCHSESSIDAADCPRRNGPNMYELALIAPSSKIEVKRPDRDLQLERRNQDHSKSKVSLHIPDSQSFSNRGWHSEPSVNATGCQRGNGPSNYGLVAIAPSSKTEVSRRDRGHSKSEVPRHTTCSQSLSNRSCHSDPSIDATCIQRGNGPNTCGLAIAPSSSKTEVSRRVRNLQVERCDRDHSTNEIPRHITCSQSLSNRSCHSEPSIDATCIQRGNGLNMCGLAIVPSSKTEVSPPVRNLQVERWDRDHSKSAIPRHIASSQSLSNRSCHSESSIDASNRQPGNGPNMCGLGPIAPPMERLQRRLSASSHTRLPQSHPRGDVSHLPHGSNHSARSGLRGTYSNEVMAPTGAQPVRGVDQFRRNSMISDHSARSGLRGTSSCEITGPTYAQPVRGVEQFRRHSMTNHSALNGMGGTYSGEITAPTYAQPVRGVEQFRRNSMTNAQIRTYEKIERYKALQGEFISSNIPVDSQSLPTLHTHLHQLPQEGYDSSSMDNRCDLRRQHDISNPDRACYPRRDLSTKDEMLVDFRSKSSHTEKIQKHTKRLFRSFSLGVSNMMNGSNQGGLRDKALASQSQSNRSLDESATHTKGRSRSSSISATRNKSLPNTKVGGIV